MHVLVTADTVGGVWTYTRELVSGLIRRGHKVTLVSFGGVPTRGQSAWFQHLQLTYYPTNFPLEWMQGVETGIEQSAQYLARIVAESQPDILHFSQFCYGALDCGVPKVVVAHSDVVSWWKAVHDAAPTRSDWLDWYTGIVSRGLEAADAVVAPSQWMLDSICRTYGPPEREQVIYNGRSTNLFRPSEIKANRVLSVGRLWDEGKQIRLLLSRKHSVPVWIAGAARHPENLQSKSLAYADHVTFCGEMQEAELCGLYSNSTTYAATSRYEPFGLAPVEASLSRCALIANDIPVFRELWSDAAFYFKRNDADDLANAIATLAEDASLRKRYADQAYECARSRFSADRMVSEYEILYESLVAARVDA